MDKQLKIYGRFLVAAIACIALKTASAADCRSTTVLSAASDDGRSRTELAISSEAVEKTPAWSPGKGEPPISVAKAVEILTPWARAHYSGFDSVDISRIELANSLCFGSTDHWYYIVEFTPTLGGNQTFGPGNWAALLMDGTVVATQSVEIKPNK